MRAYTQFESGDDHLRLGAIFSLPATWWQRACFRAELRADLRDKPNFLRDIGIGLHEAQAEASGFFWEPLLLKRNPVMQDESGATIGTESKRRGASDASSTARFHWNRRASDKIFARYKLQSRSPMHVDFGGAPERPSPIEAHEGGARHSSTPALDRGW